MRGASVALRYAPRVALLACPFCREMFEVGESKACPVCGVPLVAFEKLPASDEALSEDGVERRARVGALAGDLPRPRAGGARAPRRRRAGRLLSAVGASHDARHRLVHRLRPRAPAGLGVGRGGGLVRPPAHGPHPAQHHEDARGARGRLVPRRRARRDRGHPPRAPAPRGARSPAAFHVGARALRSRSRSRSPLCRSRCSSAAASTTSRSGGAPRRGKWCTERRVVADFAP